jgi:hypothetical protein
VLIAIVKGLITVKNNKKVKVGCTCTSDWENKKTAQIFETDEFGKPPR